MPEIFEDFKDSGVKLIDQEIDGEIEIGKENDDNEGNGKQSRYFIIYRTKLEMTSFFTHSERRAILSISVNRQFSDNQ